MKVPVFLALHTNAVHAPSFLDCKSFSGIFPFFFTGTSS
jgi:hypothetical protein